MYIVEKCKTCKYYQEHYIFSGARYSPIAGHCMCRDLIATRMRDRYRLQENCQYWENNHEVREEKKEKIRDVIRDMKRTLQHIEIMLENDIESNNK